MAPSDSYLSNTRYGYDFVVGITQASINATMKAYMASLQEPVLNLCFVADQDGNPTPMSYEEVMSNSNWTDPSSVPDRMSATDPGFQNLCQARFMCGIRAQIGIPPMEDPSTLPDVVILGENTEVKYNLYCSEFKIVVANISPSGTSSLSVLSQPRNNPWVFTTYANLNLSVVDESAYSTLPPAVRAQINNISGSMFRIQQLLLDLDQAKVSSLPTITGAVPSTPIYSAMEQFFASAYFNQVTTNGQPLPGCSIVQQTSALSTMTLTDMNLEVCPYIDSNGKPDPVQPSLSTLNYLCAADSATLPPTNPLNWNWVDPSDVANHDGILSINRDTFRDYIKLQLEEYIPKMCVLPRAYCSPDGLRFDMSCAFTAG